MVPPREYPSIVYFDPEGIRNISSCDGSCGAHMTQNLQLTHVSHQIFSRGACSNSLLVERSSGTEKQNGMQKLVLTNLPQGGGKGKSLTPIKVGCVPFRVPLVGLLSVPPFHNNKTDTSLDLGVLC